jgi:hypothetical protein
MFQVQSLPILYELKKEFEIKIVSIEDDFPKKIGSQEFQRIFKSLSQSFNIEIVTYRDLFFLPKIMNQIIQIVPYLYVKSKRGQFYYFHARGYVPAIILHYLRKIIPLKFIFDMRGVFVDELKLSRQFSEKDIRIKLWRHLERCALNSCDFAVVVSRSFKEYVKKMDPLKRTFVIKNAIIKKEIVEDNFIKIRQEQREKLGLTDKIVWIYSGSIYKWQLVPKMVEYFSVLTSKYNNLYFLIICNEKTDKVEEMFVKSNIPSSNYMVISVLPHEVRKYMIAGDVGLLLREKSIINEVSDPLKFVEYLYTGLLVIISKGIGDTEELVKKNNFGVVLESIVKDEFIKKYKLLNKMLKNKNPTEIINSISGIYDFNTSLNHYRDIYKMLDE